MTIVEEHFYVFDHCDSCQQKRRVRRLPIGTHGAAIIVCHRCWIGEMDWRDGLNKKMDQIDSQLERWAVYSFYDVSPYGKREEFDHLGGEPLPPEPPEPPQEKLDEYANLGLSATSIPGGYALMDIDGNTIGYVDGDLSSLQDYIDTVRAMMEITQPPYVAEIALANLNDELAANPRVVILWDRINGMTVLDKYAVYVAYESNLTTARVALFQISKDVMGTVTDALRHAQTITKGQTEFVVIAVPATMYRRSHTERDYVESIGLAVMDENKREFADKLQGKEVNNG